MPMGQTPTATGPAGAIPAGNGACIPGRGGLGRVGMAGQGQDRWAQSQDGGAGSGWLGRFGMGQGMAGQGSNRLLV